jgi:DNA-binding XRE family transcriptional regulator
VTEIPADVRCLMEVRRWARSGRARELRVRAGLTQAEVAGAVGVSRETVNLWEHGKRVPRTARALRYGRFLTAISLDDTLGEDERS